MLRVGKWCVDPASGRISRDGETVRLEERSMRLLLCLAARPGEVVSIDDLLQQVWPGVTVSQDSVYQAVATLRRQLRDDPKQPAYIATVPRLGYRIVATVSPWVNAAEAAAPRTQFRTVLAVGIAVVCLAIVAAFMFRTPHPARSIAVLPFLDLTEHMKEEEFADGMT